ncbi:hypothetical protein D3C86_1816990 [compost metagenome]
MLVFGAHGEFVSATEGFERCGDKAVGADGFDVRVVVVRHGPAVAGVGIDRAVGPGEVTLGCFGIAVGEGGLELATVVEGVIDFGEGFPDFLVQFVPLGIDEG